MSFNLISAIRRLSPYPDPDGRILFSCDEIPDRPGAGNETARRKRVGDQMGKPGACKLGFAIYETQYCYLYTIRFKCETEFYTLHRQDGFIADAHSSHAYTALPSLSKNTVSTFQRCQIKGLAPKRVILACPHTTLPSV